MRRDRDKTWRLSRNWNPRKKKVSISWFCLFLAAVLEPAPSWFRDRLGRRVGSRQANIPTSPASPWMDALPRLRSPFLPGEKGLILMEATR